MRVIDEIHKKAVLLAGQFHQAEVSLIDILQEVENHQVHKKRGFRSIFQYCVEALQLSEHNALMYIRISRKAVQFPALKEAIENGSLKVSSAKRICSHLTKDNYEHWIAVASKLSQRQLDKEIAANFPRTKVVEDIKAIDKELYELTCVLSEDLQRKLKRAQDVLSNKRGSHCSLEQTLEAMTELFLQRQDPVEKAKKKVVSKPVPKEVSATNAKGERTHIPAAIEHGVNLRDKGKCQYNEGGKICGASRWVHLHHIVAVSEGGKHSVDNLVTLCSFHHRILHPENNGYCRNSSQTGSAILAQS